VFHPNTEVFAGWDEPNSAAAGSRERLTHPKSRI
jgi:hypothetical protein